MLDEFLRVSVLFDFYGALLTKKQQHCLELHFSEDLSLSEIADQLEVSRQAVYDIIHRSEQILSAYEVKLGLVARCEQEKQEIQEIHTAVRRLPEELKGLPEMSIILEKLANLIGEPKEAHDDF